MKRTLQFIGGMLFVPVVTAGAGNKPANLLPKLRAGQTITYLVRYQSEKNVKTESTVATPMAPNAAPMDAHGLLHPQFGRGYVRFSFPKKLETIDRGLAALRQLKS